jgi:flagellin
MYLNFNSASATILLSLDSLNKQLNQTETELSTGNAINSAADNPAIWAEATSEQSETGKWGSLANELEGVNAPELTTASDAIGSVGGASSPGSGVLGTLDEMYNTVLTIQQAGASVTPAAVTAAGLTLTQYGQALQTIVTDATAPNGVNLLDGSTSGSTSFVEGYDATGTVQAVNFATQSLGNGGLLVQNGQDLTGLAIGAVNSTTSATNTLTNIQAAITAVTSYSASIGDMSSSNTTMQQFAQTMQTNYQNSADDLIAADPATLSTREAALQTQIQMATQALLISTQSSQLLLKLFQ